MAVGQYLGLIVVGTIVSLASFWLVVTSVDPTQTTSGGFFLFYAGLFLSLIGVLFFIGNFLRRRFSRQLDYIRISAAMRQAVFLSALVIGWRMLHERGLATWYNVLLLIAVLTMLEFFFISRHKPLTTYERQNQSTQ